MIAKQGNVTNIVRVAESGKDTFYADAGRLFCRPCNLVVDHIRKHTVKKHTKKHLYREITAFFGNFRRDKTAIFEISAATRPRFFKFLPRQDRDFVLSCLSRCRDFWQVLPRQTKGPDQ